MGKKTWGVIPTLAFGVVIWSSLYAIGYAVRYTLAYASGYFGFKEVFRIVVRTPNGGGITLSVFLLLSAVICTCLILTIVRMRRGLAIKEYLAFNKVRKSTLFKWIGVTLLFGILMDRTYHYLNLEVMPPVQIQSYRTALYAPLLWIAVILAGPILEEIFFRGFLFTGLMSAPFGKAVALIGTSTLWAASHVQYEIHLMLWGLLFGLLLGIARISTNSTVVCITMHSFSNLLSTIAVARHVAAVGGGT